MDAGEIGDATAAFARASNGGLIVTETRWRSNHHVIATLAARHKLPACTAVESLLAMAV
jgi:hypothetical protein